MKGFTVYGEIKGEDKFSPAAEKARAALKKMNDQGAKSENVFARMNARIKNNHEALLGATAAFGGFALALAGAQKAAAWMANFITDVYEAGDEIAKMSEKTSVAAEVLSGLEHAADLAGVSTEQLAVGMKQLQKNIVDAAGGTGEAVDAFERMNIELRDEDGTYRDALDVIYEMADAYEAMADPTEKSAIAQRMLGEAGAQLIPMLNQGSDAIKRQIEEAEKLGLVWSRDDAEAAVELKDSITNLKGAFTGLKMAVGKDMQDELTTTTNLIKDFVIWSQEHQEFRDGEIFIPKIGPHNVFKDIAAIYRELSNPGMVKQQSIWKAVTDDYNDLAEATEKALVPADSLKQEAADFYNDYRRMALTPIQRLEEDMGAEMIKVGEYFKVGAMDEDQANLTKEMIEHYYGDKMDSIRTKQAEEKALIQQQYNELLGMQDEYILQKEANERWLADVYERGLITSEQRMTAEASIAQQMVAHERRAHNDRLAAYGQFATAAGRLMAAGEKERALASIPMEVFAIKRDLAAAATAFARHDLLSTALFGASALEHADALKLAVQAAGGGGSGSSEETSSSYGGGGSDYGGSDYTNLDKQEEELKAAERFEGTINIMVDEDAGFVDPVEYGRAMADGLNAAFGDRYNINVFKK